MKIGSPIPEFSLMDIHGYTWQPTMAAGKILVINFWSAECPYSLNVDEQLLTHLHHWDDRVLYAAIASNANESIDLKRTVAIERHLPLVLLDSKHVLADQFNALTTPHFFVFDGEGILRYQGGFDDTNFRQHTATRMFLLEAVNDLLAGKNPEVPEALSFGCTIVRFAN